MEPLSKQPKPKEVPNPVYVAKDFGNMGVPQFPSTSKKAEENWTSLLNEMHSQGLEFVTTFNYALGADHNRRMLIFKRNEKP